MFFFCFLVKEGGVDSHFIKDGAVVFTTWLMIKRGFPLY